MKSENVGKNFKNISGRIQVPEIPFGALHFEKLLNIWQKFGKTLLHDTVVQEVLS